MILHVIMIAIALTGEDIPPRHSAQCLVEVAALTFEDLDITNPVMREAAIRKADALWANQQAYVLAVQDLEKARAAQLALVPAEIASGALPEGSEEVIRQRFDRERAQEAADMQRLPRAAPSCVWTTSPTTISQP